MSRTAKQVKRFAVGLIGVTVIIIGVVLLVLPGPAFIVIPAGFAILATEFAWARRALRKLKEKAKEMGMSEEKKGGRPEAKKKKDIKAA
jgi:tellurite resistance protein TerC